MEQELKHWYNIAPIRQSQYRANQSPRPILLQKHGFRSRSYLLETIYTRIHITVYHRCWFETWQEENKYYKQIYAKQSHSYHVNILYSSVSCRDPVVIYMVTFLTRLYVHIYTVIFSRNSTLQHIMVIANYCRLFSLYTQL